jgi:hypothetical protein
MSEHIQPAPDPHAAPTPATLPERTPGVLHERGGFAFGLIIKVGIGLAVIVIVTQIALWRLLAYQEIRNTAPLEGASSLALEDAQRPLSQRLLSVPPPHLEGIERESTLLVVRAGPNEEQRFFAAPTIHVHIKDEPARLFELREGQEVSVTYHLPGGVAGGFGVVTAVNSPPVKAEKEAPKSSIAPRTLTGTIIKIEPRSVEAARQWAEVQMERYDWADRQKEIARIPVADAMEAVLESKAFRSGDNKKGDGRSTLPTRSSSGRGRGGDRP